MLMETHKIELNTKVRLKDDRSDAYAAAHGGDTGWIRSRSIDPIGEYPMVYIEWDKSHWAYNGEHDMWTFEDHFEPIQESVGMPKSSDKDLAKSLIEFLQARLEEPDESNAQQMTNDGKYLEVANAAHEAVGESEAFIVIAIKRQENPDAEGEILVPYTYVQEQNSESRHALDLHLNQVSSMIFQQFVMKSIQADSDAEG